MEKKPDKQGVENKIQLWVKGIGISLMCISLLVLFAWYSPLSPGYIALWKIIKVNSAVCIFFSGLALLIIKEPKPIFKAMLFITALTILWINGITIFEYIANVDLKIEQFFLKENLLSDSAIFFAGRITFITAFNFMVVGITLLLFNKRQLSAWILDTLTGSVFLISLFSYYNYIEAAEMQYQFVWYLSMSVQMSLIFMLLSCGLFLANSNSAVVKMLVSQSSGGYFLRRLLPIAMLIPIILSFGENQLENQHLVGANFGDSIIAIGTFIIFGFASVLLARVIDAKEKTLTAAHKLMQQNEMIFHQYADNIDIVFFRTSPNFDAVLYTSPAYERIWGQPLATLYKNPMQWYEAIVPEDKSIVYKAFVEEFKKGTMQNSVEYRIRRPDGSLRNIFARAFQLKDQDDEVFCITGIAIDMTDVYSERKYLTLQGNVIQILENHATFIETAPVILKLICKNFSWELGEIWLVDEAENILRCINIWHADTAMMTKYEKLSRTYTFTLAEGLPGKIWYEKNLVWLSDFSKNRKFIRSIAAQEANLNCALGFPIIYKGKVYGIIEFFSNHIPHPDAALSAVLTNMGKQLGEFIYQKHTDNQIQTISRHDILTGVLNRSTIEEDINELIETEKFIWISVFILDINRFKLFNEAKGHDYGDLILKMVAIRLGEEIDSERNCLARLGGDKFILYRHDLKNKENIFHFAMSLIRAFNKPFQIYNEEIILSLTIGIANYPVDGKDGKMLITNANLAMMEGRKQGAYIQFFDKELSHLASEKMFLQTDLQQSLLKNQLILYYQPQIDLKTGLICAAEALVRWQHPTKGMIMPDDFIKYSEQSGLIVAINEHLIELVCKQIKSNWTGPPISINISSQQFKDNFHLLDYFEFLIKEYGIKPKNIELEITENLLMDCSEHNLAVLAGLHQIGFQIAIDDFGTGFSAFNYIYRLPAEKIKIDKSFITGLPGNKANSQIVKSMIMLLHSLGKIVVAEGAETAAEVEFLKEAQCDIVQGFYYYKPMPAHEFIALLKKIDQQKSR